MATLQKIRDKAGLLVAVIGIALLAFILGDLFTSGSKIFFKDKTIAFEVNGQPVPAEDYFKKVTEWEEFQKMVSGQTSLDENMTAQIRDIVYDQMVRERIYSNQAKKLGIAVTKEELNDLVHGENISPILKQLPFFVNQQTGAFDKEALINFLNTVNMPSETLKPEEQAMLNQYKSMWLFIENMVKTQRVEEKYNMLLVNSIMANDVEAQTMFNESQQNADVSYAVQNYYTIPDSAVKVSDAEIKSFYTKNKSSFNLPTALVKLTYFSKELMPSDEDFAEVSSEAEIAAQQLKSSENIATVVADYSDVPFRDVFVSSSSLTPEQQNFVKSAAVGEVYGPVRVEESYEVMKLIGTASSPDSIFLRMMAIPTNMASDSLTNHFVDSVYNQLNNGVSFADIANSLNPQSNGGEVGWVREMDLASFGAAQLVDKAFNLPIGQPTLVSIPGQHVILQVDERTAPIQKYKIAYIHMPVVVGDKTSNNVDNEINQLVSDENFSKKFNEQASAKGYSVVPSASVSATDFMLAQIPGTRSVVSWAANGKKGEVKKFDFTDLRIVARIDDVIPAGTTPMSEVATEIRAELARHKKADKIIADLKSKNLKSLDEYAVAMNSRVDTVKFVNFNTQNITGLGFEPIINAIAGYSPVKQLQGPVKGNLGVYVASVNDRVQGTDVYNAKATKSQLQGNITYRVQMQGNEVLKSKLKVKDNRYKFY
ncbi:MAG: peptidylprolyl isomerase [Dysgonamonadaceae bacterium]